MAAVIIPASTTAPVPSDSDLLSTTASLLDAMPGPTIAAPLSRLLRNVCAAHGVDDPDVHAGELGRALIEYLIAWHVLRSDQASPAGLDAWAAGTCLVFLHTALLGCARHLRRQGGGPR